MWKDSVAGYVGNGLVNIHKLREGLLGGWYEIDGYIIFFVYEPKKRKIVSTRIKDRVFQRSLSDNYLYKELTKHFIYDNAACLRGRGTDWCRKRFTIHLQEAMREYGPSAEILKCDVHDFFGSTTHEDAIRSVRKRIKDEWVASHVQHIIESFNQGKNPNVGLGLGSEITQLVELSVLDDLDHFIKEELHIKHYIRYMDDFILIHPDHQYLLYCKERIREKLAELHLEFSEKKTIIQPITQRVRFLGFSYEVTPTAKVIKRLLPENIKDERRKLKKLVCRAAQGLMTKKQVDACYQGWKAHAAKGCDHNEILKMDAYYKNLWKEYYYVCKAQNSEGASRRGAS